MQARILSKFDGGKRHTLPPTAPAIHAMRTRPSGSGEGCRGSRKLQVETSKPVPVLMISFFGLLEGGNGSRCSILLSEHIETENN